MPIPSDLTVKNVDVDVEPRLIYYATDGSVNDLGHQLCISIFQQCFGSRQTNTSLFNPLIEDVWCFSDFERFVSLKQRNEDENEEVDENEEEELWCIDISTSSEHHFRYQKVIFRHNFIVNVCFLRNRVNTFI